ncbi:hypothetical protein BX286_0189 [Streptomyces sp. 3211.6]|nr:hypothetical protein BX286_0189 [Streptomyces sp. 3211.6]
MTVRRPSVRATPTLRTVAASSALFLATLSGATPAVAGGDGDLHRVSPGDPYATCPVQPATRPRRGHRRTHTALEL